MEQPVHFNPGTCFFSQEHPPVYLLHHAFFPLFFPESRTEKNGCETFKNEFVHLQSGKGGVAGSRPLPLLWDHLLLSPDWL